MSEWSKEDLEEMFGDDITDQLAFLAGCHKHRLSNDKAIPDGWIITDESLRKFAELIVRECANKLRDTDYELVFVEDGMCDPSISDAMIIAASDLEEHFGVEE